MNELPWGNNIDLNDSQFYNRFDDIKFISDLVRSSQFGTSPSILLTCVRGVGKSALMKKNSKNFYDENYLVVYIDISAYDDYQKDEFTKESILELIFDQIINNVGNLEFLQLIKKLKSMLKLMM